MSDRQNNLKSTVQGHGTTVTEQRINRRKHLLERFKLLRIKSIDGFRRISGHGDDIDYETLVEIKNLLAVVDQQGLVNLEELSEIKLQVEEELKLLEAEQHAKEEGEEAQTIADYLMEKCIVCDTLFNGNNICGTCHEIHFAS